LNIHITQGEFGRIWEEAFSNVAIVVDRVKGSGKITGTIVGMAGEGRVWHRPEKVSGEAEKGGRHPGRNWSGVIGNSHNISREI
jgi:hypothetical protein